MRRCLLRVFGSCINASLDKGDREGRSRRRTYDRPFLDCLTEIDSAIGRLRGRGAGRIVVAGMSQGGDAALAYGARRANLAGFIALAPAAAPERQVGVGDIAQNVAQARALVAAGRGDETAGFVDRNASGPFSVSWKYRKPAPLRPRS